MLADSELTEYLEEIRRQVCNHCVERPPGGPPCAPLGKPCGIEMHLQQLIEAIHATMAFFTWGSRSLMHVPQLIEAMHAVRGDTIAPCVQRAHRQICATCAQKDGEHCPCPMDYLAALVVDAVAAVDRRHDPDAAVPASESR